MIRLRVSRAVAAICCAVAIAAGPAGLALAATIESVGEASIVHDDVPSARLEAISRARWEAVEKAAGVEVASASFVSNFTLLDDAVIKRAAGVISDSTVLSEKRNGDIYVVRVRATVSPAPARATLAKIARKNAIAVYVPARFADGTTRDNNALSAALVKRLRDEQYDVVDVADPTSHVPLRALQAAVQRGDDAELRALLYRYMSNVLLVGVVEFDRAAKPGDGAGYTRVDFDVARARLNYRLVAGEDGELRHVLMSGTEADKGGGSSPAIAIERALEELADSASTKILESIRRYVVANTQRVRLRVEGVSSMGTDQAVREILRQIAFVSEVESVQIGDYVVGYPERSLYLAASLGQRGLRVTEFTASSIAARYELP